MRSDFSSSRLVRLFGGWAPPAPASAGMDFAERLALWFSAFDAIGLQAAHRSIQAAGQVAPASSTAPPRPVSTDVSRDFRRVSEALADAVERELLSFGGERAADVNYSRYRARHGALQRQMEQMIGALRSDVRKALGTTSPTLRQLALLDAALEEVIAPREHALLPVATALLKRRFEQLRASGTPDWHEVFSRDWREALLAERDLRLAPVAGLLEAMDNELKNRA